MDRPIEARRGPSRRLLIGGAATFLLLAALAAPGLLRWSSSDRSVDAQRLRFGTVTRGDLVRDVAVEGSVVAAFRPTLTSPARGVVRVLVQAGQVVQKDQVLVRVESPEVTSRLEQQRSTLLSARADLQRQQILARQAAARRQQEIQLLTVQLEAARRALQRAQELREAGLLNAVEHERAQDELGLGAARLSAAQQDALLEVETQTFESRTREAELTRQASILTDLQRQVDELAVTSPVAGLVSKVAVDDRGSVTQGQALVGVVDLSRLEVEVWIPESYAPDIRPGTPALLSVDGRDFKGELVGLSPEVEGSRVRGVVTFTGETPPALKQKQRIATRLVLETRIGVLKLPRGPFLEALGGRQAYVVEDGEAVLRRVTVGSVSVAELEVVDGVKAGDEVVLSDPSPFANAERVLLQR